MDADGTPIVFSRAQIGLDAPLVRIEAHVQRKALPAFTLVGLPETAVREARDRVRSAITNSGFDFPPGRLTVNLAPADLQKGGSRFDLAIAIAVLAASNQLSTARLYNVELIGELGLFGDIRGVRGALCAHTQAAKCGRTLICSDANTAEFIDATGVLGCTHLNEVCNFLQRGERPERATHSKRSAPTGTSKPLPKIVGQDVGKRALTVAAAGGHHMLMMGPPGAGKTLLARRLQALLPPLSSADQRTVAEVYSVCGSASPDRRRPPFRAPHHSASAAALVGGGAVPMPGEISLAHAGVLFLDELPEFGRAVLDNLREPLESRSISLSRAAAKVRYPARFQLVAAMNPCPAGRVCSEDHCRCSPGERQRYQSRLSGPLLDRIDLHLRVDPVPTEVMLAATEATESTEEIAQTREQVHRAHEIALARQGTTNAELDGAALLTSEQLSDAERNLLERAAKQLRLSMRSIHKVLRTARTIADLATSARVSRQHITEALSYRAIDWDPGSAP